MRNPQRLRGGHGRVTLSPRGAARRLGFRPGTVGGCMAGLALLVLSACSTEFPPPSDPELAEALGLPPRTPIYRFDLADRQGTVGLFPAQWEIADGGVVQFVTRDPRVYSVHFERGAMSADAWQFLEASGQESSPPLTSEGARFVLSFEDAPPGVYPFRVEGQSQTARGEIRVRGPP
ncbi:MAG: hypothetical protein EA350_12680 [Gemmatimonadales bacterium]|nr:MAG: hypothetical protein EA350_12680 [Gemmatimonadales bacterium]